jgi:hypothetical protein
MNRMKLLGDQIKKHPLAFTLIAGSALIIVWTILRFINDKSIFDLVAQQILAREFLQSGIGDTVLGATHYLLKVFFVYVPFELFHLPPRASLIVMTLLLNILSYIGVVLALFGIVRELKIKPTRLFYIASLWLGACAGSIFWMEFANSRNIEVVGGLLTIYLALRCLNRPSKGTVTLLIVVSALTFYADPLQVYMTAAPLITYSVVSYFIKRKQVKPWLNVLFIVGGLVVAYGLALLFTAITEQILKVSFTSANSNILTVLGGFAHPIDVIKSLVASNIRFFGGVIEDGGRLRQVIVVGTTILIWVSWIVVACKKKLAKNIVPFVAIFTIFIEGVYVLSGQTTNGDTSRYLIMLAPLFIILASSLHGSRLVNRAVFYGMLLIILVNSLFLITTITASWDKRFSADETPDKIAEYIDQHKSVLFYGSMDASFTTMYYHPETEVLPLFCKDHLAGRSGGLYVKNKYALNESNTQTFSETAIILDSGQAITNYPYICSYDDLIQQFGGASAVDRPSSGLVILYYPSGIIRDVLNKNH